jgi:hypothetical protein
MGVDQQERTMLRISFLAALLPCACLAAAQAEKSNFTFSETYGVHPVGFRVVQQYDSTRSYHRVDVEGNPISGELARPIQTLIWYPAQPSPSAKPMLFGRYLELMLRKTTSLWMSSSAPLSSSRY